MPERSPDFPPATELHVSTEIAPAPDVSLAAEKKSLTWAERFTQKDHPVLKGMAYAGFFLSVAYWADVAHNASVEAAAKPDIKVVAEAKDPANSTKATLLFDGFNTMHADYYAQYNGEAIQELADGELWSIQANNARMNTDDLFKKALELAESRGITSISVSTYSMGDMQGIDTAARFVTDTDVPVETISVASGPSGFEGLQAYRQDEMFWAKTIAQWIPGARHSTFLRYVAEIYFYRDDFSKPEATVWDYAIKNTERFWKVIEGINDRFKNGNVTTNSYLLEQIDTINNGDIRGNLKAISEQADTKFQPTVYYFGSDQYDPMVNQAVSISEFEQITDEYNLDFYQKNVTGAQHSQYYNYTEQYKEAFAAAANESSNSRKKQYLAYAKLLPEETLRHLFSADGDTKDAQ